MGDPANRDFRRFWWGQAASTTGDAFAFVAMPLLVLDVTGSVRSMGYVTAVACAGQIAMSLFAGVVVDRLNRRRLMIATDLGRMALYGALPVAWWLGAQSLWLIYVVAGLASALGNLFMVGYVSAVANIVPKDDLARANSRLQATQSLTYAVGPILAGVVCARFGAGLAIAVDAASFAVSAVSLSGVRFRQERAARSADSHGGGALVQLGAGLRFLGRERVLRSLVGVMIGVALLGCAGVNGALVDVFVFHLRRDLGQGGQVVGFCLGLAAFGALLGALVAPRLRGRVGSGRTFLGGTALQAFGLSLGGLLPGVASTIVAAALWAAGLTLRAVVGLSLRQERTPDALLGRVTAASWTIIFGAATLGAVFVTHVAASFGAQHTMVLVGVMLAGAVGLGAVTPLGRVRAPVAADAVAAARDGDAQVQAAEG